MASLLPNKNATNVVFKTRCRKIDENSYVYMIPFCKSYKEFKTLGLQGKAYLIYGTDNGRMVVYMEHHPEINGNLYSFCTSHFFDRYRERVLKDLSIPKDDVIEKYFKVDSVSAIDFLDDRNGKKSFIMAGSDGIELGIHIEPNIFIHKTFLPYDYLNKNQKIESEGLNNFLKLGRDIVNEIRRVKKENPELAKNILEKLNEKIEE